MEAVVGLCHYIYNFRSVANDGHECIHYKDVVRRHRWGDELMRSYPSVHVHSSSHPSSILHFHV